MGYIIHTGATLGKELLINGGFTGNADHWVLSGFEYADNKISPMAEPLGDEILTNGGFTGNSNGWVIDQYGSDFVYDTNSLLSTSHGVCYTDATHYFALTNALHYLVSFDVTVVSGTPTASVMIGLHTALGHQETIDPLAGGTQTFDFIAASPNSAGSACWIYIDITGGSVRIDNISVKRVLDEYDATQSSLDIKTGRGYTFSANIGGTTGSVNVYVADYFIGNILAGAGASTLDFVSSDTGSTLLLQGIGEFDGTIDDVSLLDAGYIGKATQTIQGLEDGDYFVTLKVGGKKGSVDVSFDSQQQ